MDGKMYSRWRWRLLLLAALAMAGCRFDPSGVSLDTDARFEAGSPDAAPTECPEPLTLCKCEGPGCHDVCTSVADDRDHCGECGKACKKNQMCAGGDCVRFREAPECSTCPCEQCEEDDTCATGPRGAGQIVCLESDD